MVGSRSHSSFSSHGWFTEPRQWCARDGIWSAAWDPQEWVKEPAADGDSKGTNEVADQEVLAPDEAPVATLLTVKLVEVAAHAATLPVQAAAAASASMEFAEAAVQIDISLPCNEQGHTVPGIQKPACKDWQDSRPSVRSAIKVPSSTLAAASLTKPRRVQCVSCKQSQLEARNWMH